MTPVLVVLAVITAGGAVITASAREPRLAALGLVVAMVVAPYVSDPLPTTMALASRLVGAVLAGYLVWISLRGAPRASGWRPGWMGSGAVAVFAIVAGWLAGDAIAGAVGQSALVGPSSGVAAALVSGSPVPRAALGGALALAVLAAAPVLLARDVVRVGTGLLLLLTSAGLLMAALTSVPDDALQLALAAITAGGGAAVAAVADRTLAAHGDLDLRPPSRREAYVRRPPRDEAHPMEPSR